MAVADYDFFHGAALLAAVRASADAVPVTILGGLTRGAYEIGRDALYVKYSTKRMSPWFFSFSRDHIAALELLREKYERVTLALVCGHDGTVALDADAALALLSSEGSRWIRVDRPRRGMYSVSGPAGELPRKLKRAGFSSEE